MKTQQLSDRVSAFLDHLTHERGLSPHTISGYGRDLRHLTNYLDSQNICAWHTFSSHHLRQYVAQNHRQGVSGKSQQRRLSAIRTFYHYLLREGHATRNPALEVSAPRSKKSLPRTLDTDQVAQLLNPSQTPGNKVSGNWYHLRDLAMLELFYSSGLRLSELVGANLTSIDRQDGTIRVLGKGRKVRLVPVGKFRPGSCD